MRSIFAVALLATALGAGAAYAQEFKNEATPLFDSCGDPSYEKAKTDGITVGISPSPPFTSINPDTQKAEGLEVEIDEAALHWAGHREHQIRGHAVRAADLRAAGEAHRHGGGDPRHARPSEGHLLHRARPTGTGRACW